MGGSRSRSRSADRGRWADRDSSRRDRKKDYGRDRRDRSRSRDREGRRAQDRDRRASRSLSREPRRDPSPRLERQQPAELPRGKSREVEERHRTGRSDDGDRGHERGRDKDHDKPRDRDRDRDRTRDRDRDRGRDREHDRDHDLHDRPAARDRDRDRDLDRVREADKVEKPRDRSRSRERERRRWGSPRRDDGDVAPGKDAGDGATPAGGDQRRRRWRSPSPPPARHAGGDGPTGHGDVGLWNNPPPPPFPAGRQPPPAPLSTAPPPVGSIHRGTVHTIRPFGIFVAIPGYRRHVMVHNTQVSDELRFTRDDDEDAKVKALEFYFPKGEPVWVKVTEVAPDDRNPAEMRLNGSIRAVDQASGTDLDPEGLMAAEQHGGGGGGGGGGGAGGRGRGGPETDEPPEVGSIHRAVVKRIEAYGVFMALEGYRRHGLVHTSQVSNYMSFTREDTDEQKKSELAGVVSVGEQMWVKVVEVAADEARGGYKIGCSIKLVNQANGEDLDPSNMKYRPRDAPGRGPGGNAAIGATAGEVGKGGKIDWGHLAADTKLYVNEKVAAQYKLLEEEPQRPPGLPGLQGLPGPPPGGRGGPGRPGPPSSGPMGRGRGSVLPAWMTQGTAGGGGGPPAPGSLPGPPPQPPQQQPAPHQLPESSKFELVGGRDRDVDPSTLLLDLMGGGGGGAKISSIEEALAILEAHGGGRGKGSKKDKDKKGKKDKDKKGKKDKDKKGKDKKSKKSSRKDDGGRRGRSSSSGSDSDSGPPGDRRR